MSQIFYYYGRLFLGLGLAGGLVQSIVYLVVGVKFYGFNSFLLSLPFSSMEDFTSFRHVFKKVTGITLAAYKKKYSTIFTNAVVG